VVVYIRSEYKKRDHNGGSAGFLLNCNIAGKSALQILHLWHRDFHMRFSRKLFQAKAMIQSRLEARNFTKKKLLKFVNLMKIYFLFAGINMMHIQKKAPKRHILWMML